MKSMTIRQIFEECQRGLHAHAKLIKSLTAIFSKMELDEFWSEFLHHLRYSMVHFDKQPAVERTIEFISKFAKSLTKQEEDAKTGDGGDGEDGEDDVMHPFLCKFFDFLLETHDAQDKAVRYRCCQLINRLLTGLGPHAHIDDDLYDRLYDALLMRLKDKYPVVRVHAVYAVSRLQDPTVDNCPIINAYLFLMGCDTSADVRRAVLTNIVPSTKTLAGILERTRDVKEFVRRCAYQILSEKVHIRSLTIAQRLRILKEGLTDRSDMVRDACASKLVQAWLRSVEANALDLLGCLDVESSASTCQLMLEAIFKGTTLDELISNFDLLSDDRLVPMEKLTCESALYWQCVCTYVQKQGTGADEFLDKILPNITVFCQYMSDYHNEIASIEDLPSKLESAFIFEQLLSLAGVLDLADEFGRKNLRELMRRLLIADYMTGSLIKPIIGLFGRLVTDPLTRVNDLIEAISEIKEPITILETPVSKEKQRKVELKLAGISVELNEMKEELDDVIKKQEFDRAAELKKNIVNLEATRAEMLSETPSASQEVRTEKDDAVTLVKCLSIACEMMEPLTLQTIPPSIQTLVETLVLPGVANPDPAVREFAVRALGLACLLSADLAAKHLLLLSQVAVMDLEEVKIMALKVIIDMLHVFGLSVFKTSEDDGQDNGFPDETEAPELGEDSLPQSASNVLTFLISRLDSTNSEERTVCGEGLAKLMISWRVVSPKLFTKLVLLWYNPVTEDDTRLRQCLGTFFTYYAFASRSNQDVVEQAVLPTLRTLFNAPSTSPLADVAEANVAEFLVQLTNPNHLLTKSATDSSCHDSLAVKVCNEILDDPVSFSVVTLSRLLNQLTITPSNTTALRDLSVLSQSMLQVVKDKTCVKQLDKFDKAVRKMLQLAESIANTPGSVLRSAPMARMTGLPEQDEENEAPMAVDVSPEAEVTDGTRQHKVEADISSFASPVLARQSVPRKTRSSKESLNESMKKNLSEELTEVAEPKGTPKAGTSKATPKVGTSKATPKAGTSKATPKAGTSKATPKADTPKATPTRSSRRTRRCPLGDIDDNPVA